MEKCMEIAIKGKDYQTLVMQLQTRGVRFKIGNNPTRIILEEGWDLWKVTEALEVVGLASIVRDHTDHEYSIPAEEDILQLVMADGPMRTSEIAKRLNADYVHIHRELKALNRKTPEITYADHYMTLYWMDREAFEDDVDRAYWDLMNLGPMPMSTFVNYFAQEYDRTDPYYVMALVIRMKTRDSVEWIYDPREQKILLNATMEDPL